MEFYGGIEAGGTKFNCIIAQDPDHVIAETTILTKTPEITIPEVIQFFEETQTIHRISLSAMGVACFGPVNLNKDDPGFGSITSTPKIQWQNTALLQILKSHFSIPFGFDTDVNGAALGEGKWGAGKGLSDFIFITIGTGIGGGIIANGQPIHGLIHPELGHMLINHNLIHDPFEGNCPFHGDCLEGLASGPAISKRWGKSTYDLPADHPAWDLEAQYLAQAVHNMCLFYSPRRIIMGGGVMKIPGLLQNICSLARQSLNGYVDSELVKQNNDEFIVTPRLGDRAGTLGAIVLAMKAVKS